MTDHGERVRLVCPECDHPIVTAAEDHRFPEDLICPGCGALVEPPQSLRKWLDEAGGQVGRFFGRKRDS